MSHNNLTAEVIFFSLCRHHALRKVRKRVERRYKRKQKSKQRNPYKKHKPYSKADYLLQRLVFVSIGEFLEGEL